MMTFQGQAEYEANGLEPFYDLGHIGEEPLLTDSSLREDVDAAALELRACGHTYRAIAERLGVSVGMAHRRVKRAMARQRIEQQEALEDVRDLELVKLGHMERALMPDAADGDREAIRLVLQVMRFRRQWLKDVPPEPREDARVVGPESEGSGQESGVGDQESGVGVQESGVGVQESGVGDQESGVGDQESGVGVQESGVGDQESGVGDQESGVGDQESGVGVQESGVGDQGSQGGGQSAEAGSRCVSPADTNCADETLNPTPCGESRERISAIRRTKGGKQRGKQTRNKRRKRGR